jgi:hypothetical protein
MNTFTKFAAGIAGMALMAGTLVAQTYEPAPTTPNGTPTPPNPPPANQPYATQPYGVQRGDAGNYGNQGTYGYVAPQGQRGQFCEANQFIGRQVKDVQGQNIGQIKDIAFSTQTGESLAIIDLGNGTDAVVPVQALRFTQPTNARQLTLNRTKQDLEKGPIVQSNRWQQELNSPGLTQRLYSYYNLRAQTAPGVGFVIVEPVPPGPNSQGNFPKQGSAADQQREGVSPP